MTAHSACSGAFFGYRAFGLYFKSNLEIPALEPSNNSGLPEVRFHLGIEPPGFMAARFNDVRHVSPYKGESGEPVLVIRASDDGEYWLKYEEGTDVFTNSRIDELWVTWKPDSCFADAATFLLGSAMAILAQLRGATCLHGCAVVIDDAIVALLGPQGAGKSTAAAAFAQAGHAVAADDLVLLSDKGDRFFVTPSCPIVKLWPSSVGSLFGAVDALPRITDGWDKRWLNLAGGEYLYQSEPLPLAAVYILNPRSDDDAAPYIAPLPASDGLIRLIANSWAHYFTGPTFQATQFRVLSRLSRITPIRAITAHQDVGRLSDLRRIVVEDLRSIVQARRSVCGTPQ